MLRRAMLLLLATAIVPPPSAWAQDGTAAPLADADQQAIRDVIEAQLQAFQADDSAKAYSYASPGIQAMFGDAPHFMAMVRQGYPPVYRPRTHAFGPLIAIDGQPVQKLELVGPDGVRALALYTMQRQPDGSWRIDGCRLTQSDSLGV